MSEHDSPKPTNAKTSSRRRFIRNLSLIGIATTGVGVFLEKCTRFTESARFDVSDMIDQAFRLTDPHSLLNLEYYFINCRYSEHKNKITARYGPHENYMIVRLPQQHLAETNFDESKIKVGKPITAVTYISGYSYLVFRILFPKDPVLAWGKDSTSRLKTLGDGHRTDIHMTRQGLLDWDNERKFRLVVRQDLTESLFETKKAAQQIENSYPFQQVPVDTNRLSASAHDAAAFKNYTDSLKNDTLCINKVPKVYGDPVTAIELPWRLIISPRLPDSQKFKFKWDIPDTAAGPGKHILWTASLSVTERTDTDYLVRKAQEAEKNKGNSNAGSGALNEVLGQLELMILGSPDYRENKAPAANQALDKVLPKTWHRHDLVALYIKLKVLARADRITFSPLGATTQIHLKNNAIEKALKNGIYVIEWNQVISLGRDEKVEVATLFLEAEFGHKMIYIETTQRKLKNGVYALIRKEYIMPLDIEKDYTNHITQVNQPADARELSEIISRFGSPFKKITFTETKPKLLLPPGILFSQTAINFTETVFEFEAIDWQDNIIKFNKKINAMPFGAVVDKGPSKTSPTVLGILASEKQTDDQLPLNPADTLVFQQAADIIAAKALLDPGKKTIDSLDTAFKDNRKLVIDFDQSITTLFNQAAAPELNNLREKIEEFVELYKNDLATVKDAFQKIDLKAADVFGTLVHKYLLSANRVLDRNFQAIIENWAQNEAQTFSSLQTFRDRINTDIRLTDKVLSTNDFLYNYLAIQFKAIGADFEARMAEFKKLKREEVFSTNEFYGQCKKFLANWSVWVLEEFKKEQTVQGFILSFADFTKALSDGKLLPRANTLMQSIVRDSPGLTKIMDELAVINNKLGEAAAAGLLANIQQRIGKAYEIDDFVKKIPNIILLKRQKIGYAIKQAVDQAKDKLIKEATGEVKKSLSELESEYIIFEGALRQTENRAFDFFHDYAIIPKVKQAKVYISTLNKLLNEDIPISINYARDYLQNQVKDLEFEVKQNASMVFAEVQQFSRDQVNGLVKKIGEQMPGFNVEIPVHFLTYLQNTRSLKTELLKQIGYSDDDRKLVEQAAKDLVFISEEVKEGVKTIQDLEQVDPKKYFRGLGAKLFGSIGLEDILGVGFDLPRTTELPDKIIYQFSTDTFQESKLAFVAFKPTAKQGGDKTKLDLFISKSLTKANEFYAYTQLNNFSVAVVIGGTEVITVFFDSYKVTSSPAQPKKTEIGISDVKLGGVLEFIAEIAKKMQAPGNGMRIKPGPRKLELFYGIGFPNISAPAFNLKNLQLNLGLTIPYDPNTVRPISFTFGLNSPSNKFLVTAGIYGGRGHVQLRATPKGIEQIDIAMELGAYAALDLGIGKGEVFLFFGLWFVTGKDEDTGENMVKAVAYVLCCGSAVVLGFITIGVSVLISLTYIKRGTMSLMYGEAIVTYSVKIAFFKKEFSIRYYKELVGSSGGNQTSGTDVQEASILGNIFGSSKKKKKQPGEENTEFEEVFDTPGLLNEYINCFA